MGILLKRNISLPLLVWYRFVSSVLLRGIRHERLSSLIGAYYLGEFCHQASKCYPFLLLPMSPYHADICLLII